MLCQAPHVRARGGRTDDILGGLGGWEAPQCERVGTDDRDGAQRRSWSSVRTRSGAPLSPPARGHFLRPAADRATSRVDRAWDRRIPRVQVRAYACTFTVSTTTQGRQHSASQHRALAAAGAIQRCALSPNIPQDGDEYSSRGACSARSPGSRAPMSPSDVQARGGPRFISDPRAAVDPWAWTPSRPLVPPVRAP